MGRIGYRIEQCSREHLVRNGCRHRFRSPCPAPLIFFTFSLLLIIAGGCISKSKAQLSEQNAYLRGQNEMFARQQQQQLQQQAPASSVPGITFFGEVQNRNVPWSEDLSLSKAILAARYIGRSDPRRIVVIRQGQRYDVNPRNLLSGIDDPLMEPGDVVELVR